jgi:hypothetical protein
MKTTFSANPDFNRIYDEKGNICVSIILPTHKLSHERQADKITIFKAIEKAGVLLREKFGIYHIESILIALNDLYNEIDFDHNDEGIGLFVSETNRLMVRFPFPVTEKIIIGNHFEIRDLVIAEKYNTPYLVLNLNEQGIHLYSGQMDQLLEIKDDDFPAVYIDDYEYSPPGKPSFHSGSSVSEQFDKDKSVQQAIHFRNFLQKTDKLLGRYLGNKLKMIVMAPRKSLAWFQSVTEYNDRIVASIHGNFQYERLNEIANMCWKEMKTNFGKSCMGDFEQFREKIGKKLAVYGLDEVWKSAREGNSLKLLVEKDFMFTGYTDDQEYKLYGSRAGEHNKVLPDAVDELIRLVLDKNGGVCFTENDLLKDYDRIAMITRS